MEEMKRRGYSPDPAWQDPAYRGKRVEPYENIEKVPLTYPIYTEHDEAYMKECLDNLASKGIEIDR